MSKDGKEPTQIIRRGTDELRVKDWQPEWKIATLDDLGDLQKVASKANIEKVVTAINKHVQNKGFEVYYYCSEGSKFFKVVVANKKPTVDMSLHGIEPALGKIEITAGANDVQRKWDTLASEVEKKAQSY